MAAYRKLRLESLRHSPEAFGSDYEESKSRSPEELSHFLSDEPDRFMLGAFSGKQLIGMVSLHRQRGIKMRHKAVINQTFVTPGARGQGVSRQLMTTLIESARRLGNINALTLGVVAGNIEARSLYDSLGFIEYGLEKKALKVGDTYFDEALMELVL